MPCCGPDLLRCCAGRVARRGLVLLVIAGCGVPTDVTVTAYVTHLPSATTSVQPAVVLAGQMAERMDPVGLGPTDGGEVGLRLLLPRERAQGTLTISVRALDAMACTVAVGSRDIGLDAADTVVAFDLVAVRQPPPCPPVQPLLLQVTPGEVPLGGPPSPQLTLYGWGFWPRSEVTVRGLPAQVGWSTPGVIDFRPALGGAMPGPVVLSVRNPDGSEASRGDLITLR